MPKQSRAANAHRRLKTVSPKRSVAKADLTLAQRLALYDPLIHDGEVMASRRRGKEH